MNKLVKKIIDLLKAHLTVVNFVIIFFSLFLAIYLNWDVAGTLSLALIVYLILSANSATFYGLLASVSLLLVILTTIFNRGSYTEIFAGITFFALFFAIIEHYLQNDNQGEL